MKPIQNLEFIRQQELENEEENYFFKEFLRGNDSGETDVLVHALADEITPQIDCTACGNCCKSLMINVSGPETERLADHLEMPLEKLKERYIETSLQGSMIMNTIPCHFLSGTSCSIYEHRFAECRTFPGLHEPDFTGRLFSTFMHYGRCPIIFNVVEQLKIDTGFLKDQQAVGLN